MITNICRKSVIKEINKLGLPDHWGEYFLYKEDTELYDLTRKEFLLEIEKKRKEKKPHIDSQQIINKILTELGKKHTFHRQFSERHSKLHKEQVLGMQLYAILVEDSDVWMYYEIQHKGHLFPHATYFK